MRLLNRWDQKLSEELDHEIFKHIALRHLNAIVDSEVVARAIPDLVSGNPRTLLDLPCDYARLSRSDSAHLRQAQALYSKREDLELGFDKLATAKLKFRDAESLCKETNDIFRKRARGEVQFLPRVERVLSLAARKIAHVLGDVPEISKLRLRFGPGATTQIPKKNASARLKLGTFPACSAELYPLAKFVLGQMPVWYNNLQMEYVEAIKRGDKRLKKLVFPRQGLPVALAIGKVQFVPKSAKEFRSIMVEPTLNTMCQAGVGSYMAERLLTCGVNIKDQTLNQRLAKQGSVDGSLATVDLSSASDTLSIELVYDLLGLEWATFLSRFRTGTAMFDGKAITLEKFSSMGNGFTFPLETLVFHALAWATCRELGVSTRNVNTYGDDIVLPVEAYPLLCSVFTSCGFKVNGEKSFAQGPFRESCGADYYQGIDIRPVYQKTAPHTYDLFRIHNFYKRNYDDYVCNYLLQFLDPSIRLYGPDGYGDGHLLGEWVRTKKSSHARRGFGGFIFDTFTQKNRRSYQRSFGDYVLPTYTTYLSEESEDRSLLRESDARYSKVGDDFSVSVPGVSGVNRVSVYILSA